MIGRSKPASAQKRERFVGWKTFWGKAVEGRPGVLQKDRLRPESFVGPEFARMQR